MKTIKAKFRRKTFGGFNEEDVISYIKEMGKMIEETEKENEELKKKINDIQSEAAFDSKRIDEMMILLQNTNKKLQTSLADFDSIFTSAADFKSKMMEMWQDSDEMLNLLSDSSERERAIFAELRKNENAENDNGAI